MLLTATTLNELKPISQKIRSCLSYGVVSLEGELGVGKTTLVRNFISLISPQLSENQRITSPSFTLYNFYKGTIPIHHFDFYRLENIEEDTLLHLGYFDALDNVFQNKNGYLFVEWAKKTSNPALLQINLEINISITHPTRTYVFSLQGA